jgi:hypothetical protein
LEGWRELEGAVFEGRAAIGGVNVVYSVTAKFNLAASILQRPAKEYAGALHLAVNIYRVISTNIIGALHLCLAATVGVAVAAAGGSPACP